MLTIQDIHTRLAGQFGEAIGAVVEEKLDPYFTVQAPSLAKVAAYLKSDPDLAFNYLVSVTGVDQKETLASVYHLESVDMGTGRIRHSACVKVEVPRAEPKMPSVSHVWATANWHERESFDLMGIIYEGHPELKRILCDDAWEGHPLRKDYVFPKSFGGIDLT